jgi:hypothetical protein
MRKEQIEVARYTTNPIALPIERAAISVLFDGGAGRIGRFRELGCEMSMLEAKNDRAEMEGSRG